MALSIPHVDSAIDSYTTSWDLIAEDAADHFTSLKIAEFYVECSDLRHAVISRLNHAYYDAEEQRIREGGSRPEHSEPPDFGAEWMNHITDLERNDFCPRLHSGTLWLQHAGVNVVGTCPCAKWP